MWFLIYYPRHASFKLVSKIVRKSIKMVWEISLLGAEHRKIFPWIFKQSEPLYHSFIIFSCPKFANFQQFNLMALRSCLLCFAFFVHKSFRKNVSFFSLFYWSGFKAYLQKFRNKTKHTHSTLDNFANNHIDVELVICNYFPLESSSGKLIKWIKLSLI